MVSTYLHHRSIIEKKTQFATMKVLVTGAAGFIGQKLVSALIADPLYTDITITDIILPKTPRSPEEKPVTAVLSNLATQADREMLVTKDLDVIFILHGIMSGMAEKNFESGMMVNFDSTRGLLECARKVCRSGELLAECWEWSS